MNERRDSMTPTEAFTRTARSAEERAAEDRTVSGDDRGVRTQRGELPAPSARDVGLLPGDDLETFRAQWEQVQIAFVDEPREAVQKAHDLVDQLVERLTQSFTQQRDQLEGTWSRGGDVDTEALRQALQRYRSLFNRLLST